MNNDVLLEIKKDLASLASEEEKENCQELIALIEEMNIIDFEPLLDEDLNSELGKKFPGKYTILAILRDLFIEFKNSGDTKLSIEAGTCGHNCDTNCQIINLQGNNSGKNFAFGLDKSDSKIVNFHTCYGFADKNKTPKYIDGDMMMHSFRKDAEMKGKDTSRYNERLKEMMMSAVKIFYDV